MTVNTTFMQDSVIPFEGRLVYRQHHGDATRIVTLRADDKHYIEEEQEDCIYTSTSGRYAIQSNENPTDFKLWRLTDNTLLFQELWQSEWYECAFLVSDDKHIELGAKESFSNTYLSFESGELQPFTQVYSQPYQFPNLPYGSQKLYYSHDPTGRYYIYERCMGEIINIENRPIQCSVWSDAVIYDTDQQEVIYEITETSVYDLRETSNVSWSPDGRYVTFAQTLVPEGVEISHPSLAGFDLRIFDTTTHTFVQPNYTYVVRDPSIFYTWSPDSTKLAFWIVGVRASETADFDRRQLLIFDSEHGRYIETFAIIELLEHGFNHSRLYWSPDSESLVFLSPQGELIQVDANSGEYQVLDTNVDRVLAWNAVIAPTANAGEDQTMTVNSNDIALVSLDATGSHDDGEIVSYEWLLNETIIATGKTASYEFDVGIHEITLRVIDDEGEIGLDKIMITVK